MSDDKKEKESFFKGLMVPAKQRKINSLQVIQNKLALNQTDLTMSYKKITSCSSRIKEAVTALENVDYTKDKEAIDLMEVPDEYKANLKDQLDADVKKGVDTLVPLRLNAEKLRGNMIVTQRKAKVYLSIVSAQKEVLEAGQVQVEAIKELEKEGIQMAYDIEQIVNECENINKITYNAVNNFNKAQNTSVSFDSISEENPLLTAVEEK